MTSLIKYPQPPTKKNFFECKLEDWLIRLRLKKLSSAVVPKVGGTAFLGAVRNSREAVKQKWAVGGR